jgi:hypothetical protein
MGGPLHLQFEGGPHAEDFERDLFEILLQYLPTDSKTSAEEAASAIDGLSPASAAQDAETDPLAGFLSIFWTMMFRTVGQIDDDLAPMQRCILLIKTLRDLPTERFLQAQQGSDYQQKVWLDLPFMKSELQDWWRREFSFVLRALCSYVLI